MSDTYLFRPSNPDLKPLTSWLLVNNQRLLLSDMQIHLGPYWPIEVVASMNRWVEINFTTDAAEYSGAFGAAIKASDILRWRAADRHHHGAYLVALAEALDDDPTERPFVRDKRSEREQLAADYDVLLSIMHADKEAWSNEAFWLVEYMARDAQKGVSWGHTPMPHRIPYPADFLPKGMKITNNGYGGEILDTGWVLRNVVKHADYLTDDEREALRKASLFYPSAQDEVNVSPANVSTFSIWPSDVSRHHSHGDLGTVLGSFDFEGIGGRFSEAPDEYAFRLHRAAAPEPEDDDHLYAVSDAVTYLMFVGE